MNYPIRIAIVDDFPTFRMGIRMALDNLENYKVVLEAGDGKELLDLLHKAEELPHICLLDVSMPKGMNGYDTFAHLQKLFPSIAVVFLSMLFEEAVMMHIEDKKSAFFLDKNVNEKELDAVLKDIFHSLEEITTKSSSTKKLRAMPTIKEMEVLQYCIKDYSSKMIADRMNISERTVETHIKNLFEKFEVKTRTTLIAAAYRGGFLV